MQTYFIQTYRPVDGMLLSVCDQCPVIRSLFNSFLNSVPLSVVIILGKPIRIKICKDRNSESDYQCAWHCINVL